MSDNTRTLPVGCLFDGVHGYETNAQRVIDLAKERGFTDEVRGITWAEDAATRYLEQFAPEGHWVGWHEGDFGVWPEDEGDEGDEPVRYAPNQFRYVINLDERGEFSADFYRINEETGEDEGEGYHHIDTNDAEYLSEEGVSRHDGQAVMDYYDDLNPIDADGQRRKVISQHETPDTI